MNNQNQTTGSSPVASMLPLMAMREIPTPNENARQITALVKESGRVTGYQLSGGEILAKQQAVALARSGGIMGVGIAVRSGNEYLKSIPDGNDGSNLGNLPSVNG